MKDNKQLKHLKFLAKILDSQFEGPLKFKYGMDGLLGLIPGIGDFITSCASLYLVIASARLGCGPAIIIRMGFNIFLENIFDMIPFFGNIFDFYWKSNLKNIDLLEKHLANPKKEARSSKLLITAILIFLGIFLLLTVYLSFFILIKIYTHLVS